MQCSRLLIELVFLATAFFFAESSAQADGDYLLLADFGRDAVRRYDATTGSFVDTFVPKHSGGMNQPFGILFGPHDQNLYVSTGLFSGPGQEKAVLRYDGETGEFIDVFSNSVLTSPRGIIFGPDGNLYVADRFDHGNVREARVVRYDGTTGAYIDDFVPYASGGLANPTGMVFAPSAQNPNDLDLYVVDFDCGCVLRFDGTTGDFNGPFTPSVLGGPNALTFGPNGDLYVSDYFGSTPGVKRFEGPASQNAGAFIDVFVPSGSGGLFNPTAAIFGPDGNGDGEQDLYVANSQLAGYKKGNVKRYDGVTGAFIDTFVEIDHPELDDPNGLTFTETDPVTLAYTGDD